MREESSPSFFNPEEVLQVKAYVKRLLADTRAVPRIGKFIFSSLSLKINSLILTKEPAHIGIISPYRAQCTKLRNTLRQIAPEIKIGSVEEYQGDVSGLLPNDYFTLLTRCGMDPQERRVIIITTVRSSRDYINYDLRYTLGFVANPRRFNGALCYTVVPERLYHVSYSYLRSFLFCLLSTVAVTRAKALLLIVGDPMVLGLDPLWRDYLNKVHTGGGWRGRPIPWNPTEPVEFDGGYDVDLRCRALETADALAERLRDAIDLDAVEDQPFQETEE